MGPDCYTLLLWACCLAAPPLMFFSSHSAALLLGGRRWKRKRKRKQKFRKSQVRSLRLYFQISCHSNLVLHGIRFSLRENKWKTMSILFWCLNGRRNENFGQNWFIVSFLLSYEMENLISSLLESFHWNSKYFSTLHPSFRLEKDVMNS